MSRGLNKVMIIGDLGRDPEMKYTSSGKSITTFSVATNRSWVTSSGERKTETEWFRVVAWGSLAEICYKHLSKSQKVYIEGRLQTHSWEDENNNKHSNVEIVAKEMIILNRKDRNSNDDNSYDDDDIDDMDFYEDDDYDY
jgi:single-strand DNA-binding protein